MAAFMAVLESDLRALSAEARRRYPTIKDGAEHGILKLEGEAGEPSFRRLVLRSIAHIIRLYSSSLITECEVFLSMLVKATKLDLPLWHQILVLEILRGFCVEVRTMRVLFQNFDMYDILVSLLCLSITISFSCMDFCFMFISHLRNPENTNVVENMVKALAAVVSSVQDQETSDESLAAVAGMFNSKAKGIEWILDNDASNAAVVAASEAHAITLAVEGLLGVVFTVATLTDEAVDVGELESPRFESDPSAKLTGKTAALCFSMIDSTWLTILDALSLILARSQGEAIVLEILKGYQAFTQACGIVHAVEPLNSFLASLCKFTISIPNEGERKRSPAHHLSSVYLYGSEKVKGKAVRLKKWNGTMNLVLALMPLMIEEAVVPLVVLDTRNINGMQEDKSHPKRGEMSCSVLIVLDLADGGKDEPNPSMEPAAD
ncbi:hypothetical protein Dimus_021776 [Dionaea muscipula]